MLSRCHVLTGTAALIATAALHTGERAAVAPDLLPDYRDHNLRYFREHVDRLGDPDLVEIDDEFLGELMGGTTAISHREAWRDAYTPLQDAIDRDAPHLRPLLDAMGDGGGDLAIASERDGLQRGVALTCAMRPERSDPLDITTWDAFQLFPLPGSISDYDATYAALIAHLRAD